MMEIKNPEFTVLSDRYEAQHGGAAEQDLFALESRLSPMFDILRHKETVAPLAMAIYGRAGTGKTTALRWLVKRLNEWNQIPKKNRAGHPQVIPVWVPATHLHDDGCPEKSIVSSIISQLQRFATQWGMEDVLQSPDPSKKTEPADQTLDDEPCLNLISRWLKSKGSDVRIAVFIDGLDHCPPNVMMQVFDAIGFRFQSTSFIFVAGLDATVAQALIVQHYRDHGYGEVQARHYLSKIFQVECQIEPNRTQIQKFYAEQLNLLNHKTGQMLDRHLSEDQKKYVGTAILHLANNNPRNIKFLLNSALMTGHAVRQQEATNPDETSALLSVQSIQIYLLQRWLSYFSIGAAAIHQKEVSEWFAKLSIEACKPNADYQQVKNQTLGQNSETEFYRRRLRSSSTEKENSDTDPFEPPEGLSYSMIHEWVWDLLKIPFNGDIFNLDTPDAEEIIPPDPQPEIDLLSETSIPIKNALAASLEKSIDDLSNSDLQSVVSLDFSGQILSELDLSILGKLESLERLDLHNSDVKQLDWIVALPNLKVLNLTCTPVLDITPLGKLVTLKTLDLSYTAVMDLTPIACLTNIETLILYGTAIKSIAALKGLRHLIRLNLSFTGVTDSELEVLKTMPLLQNLYLRDTAVSPELASQLNQNRDNCNLQVVL